MLKQLLLTSLVLLSIFVGYNVMEPSTPNDALNSFTFRQFPKIGRRQAKGVYDEELANLVYEYARTAYCNATTIQDWGCPSCNKSLTLSPIGTFMNTTSSSQGFCGYDAENNYNIISLRGSVDMINGKEDIDFVWTKFPYCEDCYVHRGFYETYLSLEPYILECAIQLNHDHPKADLVVTGHSLGAALAAFAALDLQIKYGNIKFFYDFGQPRVGNNPFIKYWNDQFPREAFVGRLTHWKDPVPHLPTIYMDFFAFKHEIFYDEGFDNYTECDKGNSVRCSDRFVDPDSWVIEDHLYYFNQCAGCDAAGCAKLLAQMKVLEPEIKRQFIDEPERIIRRRIKREEKSLEKQLNQSEEAIEGLFNQTEQTLESKFDSLDDGTKRRLNQSAKATESRVNKSEAALEARFNRSEQAAERLIPQ